MKVPLQQRLANFAERSDSENVDLVHKCCLHETRQAELVHKCRPHETRQAERVHKCCPQETRQADEGSQRRVTIEKKMIMKL